MSKITVDTIEPSTGTTVTLGGSGDTLSVPSGVTLNVASGGTITNSGSMSGFGKVLQVVQAVKTDSFSSSSTSYVDVTGLSASITPSSTSNKILSIITLMVQSGSSGQERTIAYNLSRDSTMIFESIWRLYDYNGANGVTGSISSPITYLDSPSSTSALTYKVQIKKVSGAGNAEVNIVSPSTSSIILMEIAG